MILVFSFFWQLILLFRVDRFIWEDGIVEPWFITKGLMFDKNFYSTYLPFPKILMIPVNILTNWNLGTTVIVGFILSIATILLIYRLAKNRFAAVLYFSILYTFILAQNTFDINLWLGFLILVNIGIYFSWIGKQTKLKAFFFGLVVAATFFSTQHTIVVEALIFTFMLAKMISEKKKISHIFTQLFLPALIGAVLLIAPILYWYYLKGALYALYFWAFNYYFRDTGYPFTKFGFVTKDMILIGIFTLPIIYSSFFVFKAKKDKWKLILVWAVVIVSTVYGLFSLFHPRRLIFILPSACLLVGYIPGFVRGTKSRALKGIYWLFMIIFGVYFVTTIAPWYSQKIIKGTRVDYYNHVQVGDPDYLAVEWVRTRTDKNATLNVFSGNTLNYFEAQRLPANQRTYSIPWVYEPFDETKVIFKESPADYWIVDERLFDRFIAWTYPHQVLFIKKMLAEDYVKIVSYDYMSVYELKTTLNHEK